MVCPATSRFRIKPHLRDTKLSKHTEVTDATIHLSSHSEGEVTHYLAVSIKRNSLSTSYNMGNVTTRTNLYYSTIKMVSYPTDTPILSAYKKQAGAVTKPRDNFPVNVFTTYPKRQTSLSKRALRGHAFSVNVLLTFTPLCSEKRQGAAYPISYPIPAALKRSSTQLSARTECR